MLLLKTTQMLGIWTTLCGHEGVYHAGPWCHPGQCCFPGPCLYPGSRLMYVAHVTTERHVDDWDLVSNLGPFRVFKGHGLTDLGDWCCHLGPWRHPGTELLLFFSMVTGAYKYQTLLWWFPITPRQRSRGSWLNVPLPEQEVWGTAICVLHQLRPERAKQFLVDSALNTSLCWHVDISHMRGNARLSAIADECPETYECHLA